jgi:hypothetical protein
MGMRQPVVRGYGRGGVPPLARGRAAAAAGLLLLLAAGAVALSEVGGDSTSTKSWQNLGGEVHDGVVELGPKRQEGAGKLSTPELGEFSLDADATRMVDATEAGANERSRSDIILTDSTFSLSVVGQEASWAKMANASAAALKAAMKKPLRGEATPALVAKASAQASEDALQTVSAIQVQPRHSFRPHVGEHK